MKFYDNVIVCAYKAYASKSVSPYPKSVTYITMAQLMPLVFIIGIIKKMSGPDFLASSPNSLIVFSMYIVWSIAMYLYYPKQKVLILLEEFNKKSENTRYYWGLISILLSVIPIIGMILLFVRI